MAVSDAVVLIGHGTVERLDELPEFLAAIRHGHAAPPELVQEVRRRYEAIGGKSPLNDISRRLARKVEARLGMPVRVAMRLAPPKPGDVLAELADCGATRVFVVPLAQHSAHVYKVTMTAAAAALGRPMEVVAAANWGQTPALLEAYAAELRATLAQCTDMATTRVVMTAHSLPVMVIQRGDAYEREVRASVEGIAHAVGASMPPHRLAFQSQGMSRGADGKPVEWLGPELRPTMEALAKEGAKEIVIAPVGFLADHVEILYDLDIEAKAWAAELGLVYRRTRSLDDGDALAGAIAAVVENLRGRGA
jgi:ferrochelatase